MAEAAGDIPPFEVAIRTYNDPLLPRAIESCAHGGRPLRGLAGVVVIDDGSDPPVDIAAASAPFVEAGGLGVTVRVVHQENAGAPTARNRGIAAARTEWVVLLDSDDELLPAVSDAVAKAAAFRAADGRPAVGCACGRLFIKPDGSVERAIEPPEEWVEGGLPSEHHAFDHNYPIFSPSGYVVRREPGVDAGARCDLSINLAEDLLFTHHLSRLGPLAVFGEPTARYWIPTGSGRNMSGRKAIEPNALDILRLYEMLYHASVDDAWRGQMLYWARRYARHGRRWATWRWFRGVFYNRGWTLPTLYRVRFIWRNFQRAVRIRRRT